MPCLLNMIFPSHRIIPPFSSIWACLTLFGPVCPFGPVWHHLSPFGTNWHHLAPFGTIWHHFAPLGHFSIFISRYFKVPICHGDDVSLFLGHKRSMFRWN